MIDPPSRSHIEPLPFYTSSNASQLSPGGIVLSLGGTYSCLIELFLNDLLWHPGKALFELAVTMFDFVLNGPPLLLLASSYIVFRHILYRVIRSAIDDYQAYLDLGRGGSPKDLWGWWRVTRLKMMAGLDVLSSPHVPPMLEPYRGILWDLPQRDGPRPIVRGIAPQRQVNQRTPVSTFDALSAMITAFADMNPHHLKIEKSFLEGYTSALKLNRNGPVGLPNTSGEFGYEICHPHRGDGSVHMMLHPEDITTIIEASWGERHPLATNRWYWKFWFHQIRQQRLPVGEYLVLIYAPRNQKELAVVYKLVQASIWFAASKVLDGKIPQLKTYINDAVSSRRSSSPPSSHCTTCDG